MVMHAAGRGMNPTDYPPLYVMADSASLWGQRWHRRIIAANLVLIIIGSIFAYIADIEGGTLRVERIDGRRVDRVRFVERQEQDRQPEGAR